MKLLSHPFVSAVLDPSVIPGIYDTCDQWCRYCPATSRCLAFRCRPQNADETERQDIYGNIADRMQEAMTALREETRARGEEHPQLDALIANDPRTNLQFPPIDDPLERMGRRHGKLAYAYLMSRPDYPASPKVHADGPTAIDVLAWFHTLIAVKISRALVTRAIAVRSGEDRTAETRAAVKVALIGIDRSRAAIQELRQSDEDVRLEEISTHLRRLARELEARFPDARGFQRPGLDRE